MTSSTLLHLQTSVFYMENPLYRMDIANNRFSISIYAEGIVYMGNHAINISHPGCHAEEDGGVPDLLCSVTGRENPKGDELLLIVSGGSDLTRFRGSFTV